MYSKPSQLTPKISSNHSIIVLLSTFGQEIDSALTCDASCLIMSSIEQNGTPPLRSSWTVGKLSSIFKPSYPLFLRSSSATDLTSEKEPWIPDDDSIGRAKKERPAAAYEAAVIGEGGGLMPVTERKVVALRSWMSGNLLVDDREWRVRSY
jgi:hypothetical protein